MRVRGKRVLVCDCEHTMAPSVKSIAAALAADEPFLHTQLCNAQIDNFRDAIAQGEPVLVCCTQEAPLFDEVAAAAGFEAETRFVNIREWAGWAAEGRNADAKMAALIAEAALDVEPTPAVTLKSEGVCLVYGDGETALDAARRLARRLDVTCLLRDPETATPPAVHDVPVFKGRVRQARGHLGAFEVTIDEFAESVVSSRSAWSFGPGRNGAQSSCDLIVDLSGDPALFPAAHTRDGYFRAEPSDLVAIERVLFDAADMAGEFEKPRYLKVDPAICAHARNQIVGCELCLNVCPTGAITPNGDHTVVDPHICSGHGACASVCPTGAIVFDLPRGSALFERLRVLTQTYRRAGGSGMVLLVHDPRFGGAMIDAIARHGDGLPAHAVPFAVHEITLIGLDFLLSALAYGVAQVRILADPALGNGLDPLHGQIDIIGMLASGLGYADSGVVIDEVADPQDLERRLKASPPEAIPAAAGYRGINEKRTMLKLALAHLHQHAPTPVEVIDLPDGAPFGEVRLHYDRCTLCLSCVGVCPTAALGDNPETPQLTFTEINCVQCGLCRNTCPEDAIVLSPRLNFAESARGRVVLKQEEPFHCIRCGKPFGTQSTIGRLVDKLSGHSMFAGPGRIELLKMCEDCRVKAQFEIDQPFAMGTRPIPRTTDDYLREREQRSPAIKTGDDEDS